MDIWAHLSLGFSTAVTPENLMYCLIGTTLGTLIGVLPGIGPVATIAMLLPLTFNLDAVPSLIMLAGIFYGAQYGGSTTAILLNLPGETSSVVTAIDGHKMAAQGRAGPALATAALGSFFAGTVATCVVILFAPPLAAFALQFNSGDYFALIVLGLIASVALASGSVVNALAMLTVGLLLGVTGRDIYTGAARFTYGSFELSDGLNFVAIAMGLFGLAEVMRNLDQMRTGRRNVYPVSRLMLNREEFRRVIAPVLRGTALGSLLGILPGGGATLSSFSSYALEKKVSRYKSEFGHGAIEGVAGPESANNAAAQTSFIPMLTLGIPSNSTMALMVGALIIQGIQPGPNVVTLRPDLFWGLIFSMWIGNLMLVVLNLPLIGIWVKLLRIPYHFMYPAIIVFCCIGVYSVNNTFLDVYIMIGFGVVGYVLSKLRCDPSPLLFGFVLGPLLEEHLRRAMLYSRGDPLVLLQNPISAGLLFAAAVLLVLTVLPAIGKRREEIFKEED
ncbi:hypothetical protein IZ6_06510 [Terrihabitans soli]|uniref:DUF112 domain-containing protein n=1 Tax=Terrihabitans soli TaxID=708113 RepID=A0A6S6QKV8_9HYPH|nr:tripartite tricarboxylate transporter permease [Terrihabitans soli]BCJ89916.1 hypothetical protein IZ6_06510 [Terrihabitans soli]